MPQLRVVTEQGQKKAQGMIFVPSNVRSFVQAKIEPLIIALIRNGSESLTEQFEELQKAFNGELEIFTGASDGNVVITAAFSDRNARVLQAKLQTLMGSPFPRITTRPDDLNEVARTEMRSSLKGR